MMNLVEAMIHEVAVQCDIGETPTRTDDNGVTTQINLERPWRRVTLWDIVEDRTGWKYGEPLPTQLFLSCQPK
jgi:lysyl-tRNA synthetase class II